jgi:adenylate cyclase
LSHSASFESRDKNAPSKRGTKQLTRNPDSDISRVLLAASYGHLGRIDEARASWQELLRVNPNYSLEHRRKVLPYRNPSDFELVVEGLRKAGLGT